MSKSLKKLIDIDRLREFKNKIVGTDSAYVQTTAVDQTIAGTKTFSKPIVGSVTGSSGSCTGNAATATTAATAEACTGNAATATKLATARTIALSGAATGTATAFDGSGNITIPVTALASSAIRDHILSMVYPVGSVYISVNDVSPEKFLGGKWTKISQGRVLQGASGTQTAGTEVSAGLPNISVSSNGAHAHTRGSMNITGEVVVHGIGNCTALANATGAFYTSGTESSYQTPSCWSGASSADYILFSADRTWTGSTSTAESHSHNAYIAGITGKSTTVQPPALLVNIWKRTA